MNPSTIHHDAVLPPEMVALRLDLAVAKLFPQYSRACLQRWIRSGELMLDGRCGTPREKVLGGERIVIAAEPTTQGAAGLDAEAAQEDIPLRLVFEDASILVIDKPAGLVVHPGAGNPNGTLLNGLLHFEPALAQVPRAGIVHRLDKDTSGLMVIARNIQSRTHLVKAITARSVTRIYDALVYGILPQNSGTISAPIARHPVNRKIMTVRPAGKPAVTHYRVVTRFAQQTHVECRLDTGRTHQIRVHLKSLGYPLIGDPLYGGHLRLPPSGQEQLADILGAFPRQALHARQLAFAHPETGKALSFTSPHPPDLAQLLAALSGDF